MRGEPRPVALIWRTSIGAIAALLGWWFLQRPAYRMDWLTVIWQAEQASTPPPLGYLEQLQWLAEHRVTQLTSLAGVVGLALGIGILEGIAHRQTDIWAGFRLSLWTVGIVGVPVLLGVVLAYHVVPRPLPLIAVGAVLSGTCLAVGYALAAGRPLLP